MSFFNRLLILFFALPLFSLAQSNYKPGYVVSMQGDTIHGYIDYKQWDQNPTKINFKTSLQSNGTKTYDLKNSSAFSINGYENYRRYTVSVSQDVLDIDKLKLELDTAFITDTVFLKITTSGKYLTLFKYTDKIKERYYYQEKGTSQPIELAYHAYLNQDIATIQYVNSYRLQFKNVITKFDIENKDKIIHRILNADYKEGELIKIAEEINGPSSIQFSQPSLEGSRWFVGIGASVNQLKFDGTGSPFPNTTSSNSILPKITGGLDFFPNKSVQLFFLRLEYTFQMNKYKISGENNSGFVAQTNTLDFNQYNNTLMPQVVLNIFNKESIKVFINAGVGLNFSAYNHYQTINTFPGTFEPPIYNIHYPEFNTFWASFAFGGGLSFNKKIEVNFRYISSASMTTNYGSFAGSVTSYQFGINYLFGK